jgi:hypothetical protein
MSNGRHRRPRLVRSAAAGLLLLPLAAVGGGRSEARTYIATLPPGSLLPSSAVCQDRVQADPKPREPRPANAKANSRTGGKAKVVVDGGSDRFNARHAGRIRGDFKGSTEQILRWAACKWGLDEDITKARAVQESWWRQSQQGDQETSPSACRLIGKPAPCWTSYGVLQVKGTVHEKTYPTAQKSTPFNADHAMAWQRACFEGDFTWLGNGYRAGDEWGCVGAWNSGNWYDPMAVAYIARVKDSLTQRTWELPGF